MDTMSSTSIPSRDEIAESDTWDLTKLYASEEGYQGDLERLKHEYPRYESFRGKLGQSADLLAKFLEFDRSVDILAERLGHYTSLRNAEDSSNPKNLARKAELANLMTKVREVTSFVTPEILAVPDDRFDSFLQDTALAEWRNSLRRLRRFRPHTLSENEEKILAAGAQVVRGHHETFSQLTNVDMSFGIITDGKGREVPLSQTTYISLLHNQDREVRRRAFEQFYKEFSDHRYTLASSLASSIRGDVFYARIRNYPSALEASLFGDDVPVAVYDNLIEAVRVNVSALHDYYDLRKQLLGLDEIHQFDTFVPLFPEIAKTIPFDEAIDLVTAALEPLGDEYVGTLRNGLKSRWADRYETKGKRSGAFSSSSYGNPPYILMNYRSDVLSDVFTLAHEAGHSMHSWFSQKFQPYQDYGYPIFLAEVASTFNEELLTQYLLQRAEDDRLRAYLIDRQIEDIRSVLFRQTMFAEFEKQTHAIEEAGGPLTLDVFTERYRALLEGYFGPRFVLDDPLKLECLRIPHFYSAFYVYKYATGISAAIALAQRVIREGAPAVDDYLNFLRSGGSKYPIETLQLAGVDMQTPDPVEETIGLFRRRLRELRELAAPAGT
ncbi:MAG: oligoendopeptidase F [Verrucomicrobia bacterium]|nr:oligoendopeptidase F [Verrucomicrobiota bacterium]MBV9275407.1 oligoendopeptidase F [Verrucomicrobiota bacterium]